jgi:hypothetical protein
MPSKIVGRGRGRAGVVDKAHHMAHNRQPTRRQGDGTNRLGLEELSEQKPCCRACKHRARAEEEQLWFEHHGCYLQQSVRTIQEVRQMVDPM